MYRVLNKLQRFMEEDRQAGVDGVGFVGGAVGEECLVQWG